MKKEVSRLFRKLISGTHSHHKIYIVISSVKEHILSESKFGLRNLSIFFKTLIQAIYQKGIETVIKAHLIQTFQFGTIFKL